MDPRDVHVMSALERLNAKEIDDGRDFAREYRGWLIAMRGWGEISHMFFTFLDTGQIWVLEGKNIPTNVRSDEEETLAWAKRIIDYSGKFAEMGLD